MTGGLIMLSATDRHGEEPRAARRLEPRIAAIAGLLLLLLAGCHGSTQEAIYSGTLGHDPPPAVNLPPQDRGLERL
jgi:hypothetical protein